MLLDDSVNVKPRPSASIRRSRRYVNARTQPPESAPPRRPADRYNSVPRPSADRRASVQEKRNVAAQLRAPSGQLRSRAESAPGQHRKRQQHRRRVARSSAQSPRPSESSSQIENVPGRGSSRIQRPPAPPAGSGYPGCRRCRRWSAPSAAPVRYSNLDRVGQRNGLKDRAQFVKPVGALVQHPQIEIDFRERASVSARISFGATPFLSTQ